MVPNHRYRVSVLMELLLQSTALTKTCLRLILRVDIMTVSSSSKAESIIHHISPKILEGLSLLMPHKLFMVVDYTTWSVDLKALI
jgi:hypothetical protein